MAMPLAQNQTTHALFFRIAQADSGQNHRVERWQKIEETQQNIDKYQAVPYTGKFYAPENKGASKLHRAVIFNDDLQDEEIMTVNANDVPLGGNYIKFKDVEGPYGLIDRRGLRKWIESSSNPSNPGTRDRIAPTDVQVIQGDEGVSTPHYKVSSHHEIPKINGTFFIDWQMWHEDFEFTVSIPDTVIRDVGGTLQMVPVTEIKDKAFEDCYGLISVEIPKDVTRIGNKAFMLCEKLTSVELPDGVTTIGKSAFEKCRGLTSVELPGGVTTIGEDAFHGCKRLTSVNIPDGVTQIKRRTFSYCSALTSIIIPEGVTRIGDFAFDECRNLSSVTIPESVVYIGELAFGNCFSLESVTIPENVKLGNYAFPDETTVFKRHNE